MELLTVNAGSSSVRLATYAWEGLARRAKAHAKGPGDAAERLHAFAGEHLAGPPRAIAHRVVHGGARFTAPALVDAAVEDAIRGLVPLAPLHNPPALAWIAACRERFPGVPQVVVFDTAFFADLPEAARTYALPRALAERVGARRHGFHGIAHEAMWHHWSALHPERGGRGRVISFQLGAGCSAAAVRDGKPMDTSMGFSPLEGLVMATRAGDVDAGLLLHLQKTEGLDAAALERMLNQESGLLGLAGTGDMQALRGSNDPAARLAIEVFCHRARRYLGAFLAVLGGADAILFGGGVGEHDAAVRARIVSGLESFGISLDGTRNGAATDGESARIDAGGGVEIHVVAVDEAALIARQARQLLDPAPGP